MTWQVQARLDQPIIAIIYESLLTTESLTESIKAAQTLAQDQAIRCFLEDYTAVTQVGPIAGFATLARSLFTPTLPRIRIAVLHPPSATVRASTRYWENVRYNRGITVQSFTNQKQALDWLRRWDDCV